MTDQPEEASTVLAEMRGALDELDGKLTIERVLFGPPGVRHAIRIMRGGKRVGPLLFPSEGKTIGECLDVFLGFEP